MVGYGSPPAGHRPPLTAEGRAQLFGYVAGALALLSFVWGFLDWASAGGGPGVGGYATGAAPACVGLTLVAGLLASARAFEHRRPGIDAVVVAIAGLLVVFGVLVGKESGIDAEVGLILQLITAIAQVAVLVVGWLMATGRMPASRQQGPPPGQWQGPPQGYQPPPQGYQQPPQGYQPPPPQGYQQPPPGYQQPPQGYQPPQS